jgi:hypothetical protein
MAGATQLTGLTFNPFSNLVVAVDDASNRYTFDPATFAWSASLPPVFAPPPQATGTQICLASARTFVTYHNGDVRDIATGMLLPFPPNPGGVRQHQGLTYMGTPVWIGGGGNGGGFDPVGCPWAGNLGFGFQVNLQGSSGGRVFVVIDVGGQGAPITLGSSTAFVNPSTSTILDLGNQAQSFLVPLPIPEAALGSTAVIQAAILRPDGSLEMLDAWQGQVFKLN